MGNSDLNSMGEDDQPRRAARLLAVVEVDKSERVNCQEPGCGHTVYKAIHVVRDGGQLLTLGSTCFEKRYGGLTALGTAQYGGVTGKRLTPEERLLLTANTEALLARFEQEQERLHQEMVFKLERLREAQARHTPPAIAPAAPVVPEYGARGLPTRARFPWPWMMPVSSVFAIKLRDGSGWVRVQHRDGRQFIVPWPSFEGWEEALPPVVGRAQMEVGGYEVMGRVEDALAFLRAHANRPDEKITGLWADVITLLGGTSGSATT